VPMPQLRLPTAISPRIRLIQRGRDRVDNSTLILGRVGLRAPDNLRGRHAGGSRDEHRPTVTG
jgi:hypothetical protein